MKVINNTNKPILVCAGYTGNPEPEYTKELKPKESIEISDFYSQIAIN